MKWLKNLDTQMVDSLSPKILKSSAYIVAQFIPLEIHLQFQSIGQSGVMLKIGLV